MIKADSKIARATSYLTKPGVMAPIVLLEAAVIVGRTYQGNERGGFIEARERFVDETSGAIFWLGGAKFLNGLFNKFGKKFLKLEHLDYDVGKDNVRAPFENLLEQNPNLKNKKLLSFYKFGKVISSVVIAAGFLGFVVPKINQAITRKLIREEKQNEYLPPNKINTDLDARFASNKGVSFKGNLSWLNTVTDLLENNATAKLATSDGLIIPGRVSQGRNKSDKIEYGVKDVLSIYFYFLARKHTVKFLNYLDPYHGKNGALNSNAATHLSKFLSEKIEKLKEALVPEEFRKHALESAKENKLGILKFENGIISLDKFLEAYPQFANKASETSKLQPALKGIRIITKEQALDILSQSWISEPEILKKVYNASVEGDISDPKKLIAYKDLKEVRENAELYIESIIDYAKHNHIKEITPEVIQKCLKRNINMNALYLGAGFLYSIFGLAWLVPKIQYKITEIMTGENSFPGAKQV